jgi:hypothetical protein
MPPWTMANDGRFPTIKRWSSSTSANAAETDCLLSSALIYWAEDILNRAGKPEKVTLELEKTQSKCLINAPSQPGRSARWGQGR